jgi:hypothetical protein
LTKLIVAFCDLANAPNNNNNLYILFDVILYYPSVPKGMKLIHRQPYLKNINVCVGLIAFILGLWPCRFSGG